MKTPTILNKDARIMWFDLLVRNLRVITTVISCLLALPVPAQLPSSIEYSSLQEQINQSRQVHVCGGNGHMSMHRCREMVSSILDTLINEAQAQVRTLKDDMKQQLHTPVLFNTVVDETLEKEDTPLHIEFESFTGEDEGESMLALSYELEFGLDDYRIVSGDGWYHQFEIDFLASGQFTNISHQSPENLEHSFVNAIISFSTAIAKGYQGIHSDIEQRLLNNSLALACGSDNTSPACQSTVNRDKSEGKLIYPSNRQPVRKSYHRYEIGMDVGYEGDEETQARQQIVSAFVAAQYKSRGTASTLGMSEIQPSLRVGVDSIYPEENTPRVRLGDDSQFYRVSSEVSLSMPLESGVKNPLTFSFNYQYNQEIGASDSVKNARLDSYSMHSYSISSTNGIFVNYTSGKMPLDQFENEVVQLGWKTQF